MKHFVKQLTLLIFFCIGSGLFAESSASFEPQKLYINSMDITIDGQMMYACLADNWVKVDALRSDVHGLYVYEDDLAYDIEAQSKTKQ